MTTFFLFADALRSAELRHEIGEPIMDPIGFVEHDGRRIVIAGSLEEPTLTKREDVVDEFINWHHLGVEELIADRSFPIELLDAELARRALKQLGVDKVVVPANFGVLFADYLRDRGIEVVVDEQAWTERRRRKTPWEIEGIERAQRAAETAMLTAARMLREAEPTNGGRLRFEGEILTAELIREAMTADLLSQGTECEEILIHSGDACLSGHDVGTGPILPHTSCIIDCFPRDRRTSVYSDMTRTFVPGRPSDELAKLHAACREALAIALAAVKPGADDVHQKVATFFAELGYPTKDTHKGDDPLVEGFSHSLGHGVGLQVHEKPWVGRRPDPLVEGDVIAIEPGLYFAGVGGVRLEDTVLVTTDGPEHFTDPLSYDLTP